MSTQTLDQQPVDPETNPAVPLAPPNLSKPARYWLATRPYSFTASVVPAVFGSVLALALHEGLAWSWVHFVLAVVGCVLIHTVSNLVNDIVDFDTGLDNDHNFGAANVLVQGLLTRREMIGLTIACLGGALAIGVYFALVAGPFVWALVGFGVLSAIFYTAPPFKLKYRGWGDIQVVLSFGILMMLGAYYTQAYPVAEVSWASAALWTVVAASLPLSLLVDAILQANNHRDLHTDPQFGANTLAARLGEGGSLAFFYALVLGAYAITVALVVFGVLSAWTLLSFLSLPLALKVLRKARGRETLAKDDFGLIVMETAQLHLAFGVLMIAGTLLDAWVG